METKLRKELGDVIPHMSIVDIATRELFSHDLAKIEQIAKRYKHSRLSISHLPKAMTMRFVFLSQIAFIASKADAFCDDVREFIKQNTTTAPSPNLEGLDNLRKAIYLLDLTKADWPQGTKKKDDESLYNRYVDSLDLAVVDYYRKIRNIQFHGGLSQKEAHPILSEEAASNIKKKYNYRPNHLTNLTARDAILFSRSWQSIAVSVCRNLVDIDVVVENLCKKYARLQHDRRDNAITNALRQDYLQTEDNITILRQGTNGWIA
jgi:hypothetical protein